MNDFYRSHVAVVPSDSTVLHESTKAIYCLTSGNCIVQDASATQITYPMTAGQLLKIKANKVMAASTGTYAALR
jgi:hypothetical protein